MGENTVRETRRDESWVYYVRDEKNRPVITVALICRDGFYGRGIAICSRKDQPCKKRGRDLAMGRAAKAYYHGVSTEPVRREEATSVLGTITSPWHGGWYKSMPMISFGLLTDFERKLVYQTKGQNNENEIL